MSYWPALTAGIGLFVLPRAMWAATEARSYAMAMLATSLVVYCFLRAVDAGTVGWWACYGLALAAATLLFLYSATIVAALAAAALVHSRKMTRWRSLGIATAVSLIALMPFVTGVVSQRDQVSWISLTQPADVAFAIAGPLGRIPFELVIPYGLLMLASTAALIKTSWSDDWPPRPELSPLSPRASGVLLLGWLVLPSAILLIANAFMPVYSPRYASISTPALALLLGELVYIAGRFKREVSAGVLVLVTLLGYPRWIEIHQNDAKSSVNLVADTVETLRRGEGEAIWFDGSNRTARDVLYAHPEVFAGTVDLTLASPPGAEGRLYETTMPLTSASSRLTDISRIIGIVRKPEMPGVEEDLRWLRTQGFCQAPGGSDIETWRILVLERC